MVQQGVAESSSGDASSRASAFYNYHSMSIPSSGIDNIIKFVSSQLSISLLQLFFCCDVRATPLDILYLVEKIPNCEIVHINLTTKDFFEQQISNRIIKFSSTGQDQVVLISDYGNYSLVPDGKEDSQLVIFHPPNADVLFDGITSIRSIELPVTIEENLQQSEFHQEVIPAASNLLHELGNHNKNLKNVAKRLTKMNEEIISHAHQEVNMLQSRLSGMDERLKKMRQSLKLVGRKMPERNVEKEEKQYVKKEEAEEKCEENRYTEDDGQENDSGRQVNIGSSLNGNGWDSFPDPEQLSTARGGNGWDEVDKEMEAEQRQGMGCRPGMGANPFQEKKNPFGGNPFGMGSQLQVPMSAPRQQHQQSLNPYNQHLYEDQTPSVFNGAAMNGFQPKGCGKVPNVRPAQENNPFGGSGGPIQSRVGRNPFSIGGGGGPVPGGGFQTQPTRGVCYDASGAQMIASQEGGFKKPAPQCPQWENRVHRAAGRCQLWHPHKLCMFFPKCRATAGGCGYAHPFCTEGECQCEGEMKDPQLNHFFADE